jgi:hypothetical protein
LSHRFKVLEEASSVKKIYKYWGELFLIFQQI